MINYKTLHDLDLLVKMLGKSLTNILPNKWWFNGD